MVKVLRNKLTSIDHTRIISKKSLEIENYLSEEFSLKFRCLIGDTVSVFGGDVELVARDVGDSADLVGAEVVWVRIQFTGHL